MSWQEYTPKPLNSPCYLGKCPFIHLDLFVCLVVKRSIALDYADYRPCLLVEETDELER